MNITEIIERKKLNECLNYQEFKFWIEGMVAGEIPDYQTAALLMAIRLNGLDEKETVSLTKCMINSGATFDFGHNSCDKHSTGGVGDSTTFIVLPVLSVLGYQCGKMSGRGLGLTGGTIDKLESITGFRTNLSFDAFLTQLSDIKIALIGQSSDMCTADKKLYELRDVTSTMDSIPLIASSIMSKKVASGAKNIVIDIKCGKGAFMKNYSEAIKLKNWVIMLGKAFKLNVSTLITNMDAPLSNYIGNALELIGVLDVLKGECNNLYKVSCSLVETLLSSMGIANGKELFIESIESGKALKKFTEMIAFQGGDIEFIQNSYKLIKANCSSSIFADKNGYITSIDAHEIAKIVCDIGGGRQKKGANIDYSVGIHLLKCVGDRVIEGEETAILYYNKYEEIVYLSKLMQAIEISDNPKPYQLIFQ